ncbi:PilT/PilU family type 4a pilus ATPase [Crenobacter cavernae]|uniref:PilT/PilU family type 4a pilus ATPase n=1 Tax=Crenobacter cavernae TaxID=2290923 RepID=A0A345Y4Q7_9NEIS|nr:PilT/PilU family type 4a pilus ATPase [Crenobacter cavernae]AXK38909.1 PilT/PilU family type 4a pilus ATPase [Crenobacter cavernae]RXZ43852.1 PilT/PilU family type 4a pilus ATPase [Crenobacter cavernae]
MEKDQASRFIHDILKHATGKNASDVFIAADFPAAMKIDGKITPVSQQVLSAQHSKELVRAVMNDRQTEEFEATREANFAISPPGVGRFRVSAYQEQGRVGMVLRKINTEIPTVDGLGLPEVLKDIGMIKRGLVIFVGGTGSGKSTSLAAMVDWRNSNAADHIITIEDPIEFVHAHKKSIVTQREIGVDTDGWNVALKNTLRQAPDVILMGEIRDSETMGYALQFAETGHLCLATLHANNANQALDRILNFFPEERHQQVLMDLSLNMRSIISQRLVPKRGARGRVAAVEILLNSPLVADMIFKGEIAGLKEVMGRSREGGMQTFDQALFDLFEEGLIGYEDALKNADSVNDLRLKIKLYSEAGRARDPLDGIDHLDIL